MTPVLVAVLVGLFILQLLFPGEVGGWLRRGWLLLQLLAALVVLVGIVQLTGWGGVSFIVGFIALMAVGNLTVERWRRGGGGQ